MGDLTCPAKLEKILLCTDGSPASQGAVNGALALAQVCGSQLYVLDVLEVHPVFEGELPQVRARIDTEIMEPLKARAAEQQISLSTAVRRSKAAYAAILAEAEEIRPDLIIMGRHGRTGLARLMLGSVTARVIGYSPFHVLVVPRAANLAFNRLLIASDGSRYSEAAWEVALAMTRQAGSHLLAVVVARDEAEFSRALKLTQKLLTSANRQGLPVETRLLQGQPEDAIFQAALEAQADLILLGSHGRTGLKRLLMGSVTERVVVQAPCPVLVVKRS